MSKGFLSVVGMKEGDAELRFVNSHLSFRCSNRKNGNKPTIYFNSDVICDLFLMQCH